MRKAFIRGLIVFCALCMLARMAWADQTTKQEKLNSDLFDAMEDGDPFRVSRLLHDGADANTQAFGLGTVLYVAAAYRRRDEVLDYDPVTNTWRVGKAPHLRIQDIERGIEKDPNDTTAEHLQIIELLLEYGAHIEARDPDTGKTPLMNAAEMGNRRSIELLLEHGANMEALDTRLGLTVLMYAVCNDHDDANALALLQRGAKVNAKNQEGTTALMMAAANLKANVALLLWYGADVNAHQSKTGRTALTNAARFGCIDNVRLLLEHGADVNARETDGTTALMYAAKIGDPYLVPRYDLAKDAMIYTRKVGPYNTSDLVALLLAKGAKINARDSHGFTALHYARDPEIIRFLKRR